MKIQLLNPQDLKRYENNNKTHPEEQIELIQESISENGFINPIIVDENMVILAGHARHEASIKQGLTEVPVIMYNDMTDDQKREYRLVDNRLGDLADWDKENIIAELGTLEDEKLSQLFEDRLGSLDDEELLGGDLDDDDDYLGTKAYQGQQVETGHKTIYLIYNATDYVRMVNGLEKIMTANGYESISETFYQVIKQYGNQDNKTLID